MVRMRKATTMDATGCAPHHCRGRCSLGCQVLTCVVQTCPTTCGGPGSISQPLTFILKLKSNHSNGIHMLNILCDQYKPKTGLQRCVLKEETTTKSLHMGLTVFTLLPVNRVCFQNLITNFQKTGTDNANGTCSQSMTQAFRKC